MPVGAGDEYSQKRPFFFSGTVIIIMAEFRPEILTTENYAMTLPNLLSCSRYFLALPMAYLVFTEAWAGAAIIFWIAVATDIADGHIARIRNQSTALGGFLDHSSDAFFVTALLLALSQHDTVSLVLPGLVVAAFLQYTLDSKVLAGHHLRTSSLGRYNGISYFIFGGLPVMQNALQIHVIPNDYFPYLGWGLVLSTSISMLDRAVTLIASKSGSSLDK